MPAAEPFSPQAIVQTLKADAVQVHIVHLHAEYDDFYRIWYTPSRKHFAVRLEVSVWDGRGHESYKETLDEAALLERLETMRTTGKIASCYYTAR